MEIIKKEKTRLSELPKGSLFMHGNTIALKSEYRTEQGAIEAFILGSGEMFWGGANSVEEQRGLYVNEIEFIYEPTT